MATVRDLRDRLRRPLRQELKDGCRDRVVVGGIEKLVATVGAPFRDLHDLFRGYGEHAPREREARVRTALTRLDAADAAQAAARDAEVAAAGRRQRTASASRSEAVLDAELSEGAVPLAAQAPKRLEALGIRTYRDLLQTWPRRYEDRRALPGFAAIADRDSATVQGELLGRKAIRSARGLHVLRAFLQDRHGDRLTAVWFNQPWLEAQLFPGRTVILGGRVKRRGANTELHVAHHEVLEGADPLSTDRIVAIYRTPQGMAQDYLRKAVHALLQALPTVPDPLPKRILERYRLTSLDRAVRQAHLPDGEERLAEALTRLRFDEFLYLELRLLRTRRLAGGGRATAVRDGDVDRFLQELPFQPTGAQRRAVHEIARDLASPRQMARMLQGDVGSGKTAVAAAAAWLTVRAGRQAALMAPTEILARQHYANLRALLHPLGVRCDLLIGGQGSRDRRETVARARAGGSDLVVGTHALIQEPVTFADLGLAIVDEEHRFGVEQRRALLRDLPDVLVMSATPIPRSLALTAYGDLDLTTLDELPPGRTPVRTELARPQDRTRVYREVVSELRAGRQAFVVAPLIEASEAETMQEVSDATTVADDLRAMLPSDLRIELLHGRMPPEHKEAAMERFRRGEVDLLVATTVVEVGVDVPNATVMVIENAERFGLAQLHQLRGRVGRGADASRCILVAGEASRRTMARLRVVRDHTDGFVIAEKDLELRGPGELRGTRQSGLPDLRLGDLVRDAELIEQARELAIQILDADPRLQAAWAQRLRQELTRRVHALGLRQVI